MKRYSISTMRDYGFQYFGRTDDLEKTISDFSNSRTCEGIRITDSQTKKVVFEEKRPFKGALIVTLSYKDGTTVTRTYKYVNLDYMREEEHEYLYGYYSKSDVYKVERVERNIY